MQPVFVSRIDSSRMTAGRAVGESRAAATAVRAVPARPIRRAAVAFLGVSATPHAALSGHAGPAGSQLGPMHLGSSRRPVFDARVQSSAAHQAGCQRSVRRRADHSRAARAAAASHSREGALLVALMANPAPVPRPTGATPWVQRGPVSCLRQGSTCASDREGGHLAPAMRSGHPRPRSTDIGKWFVSGLGHEPISHMSPRQAVPVRGLSVLSGGR
jgi:hypothetical protein